MASSLQFCSQQKTLIYNLWIEHCVTSSCSVCSAGNCFSIVSSNIFRRDVLRVLMLPFALRFGSGFINYDSSRAFLRLRLSMNL